MSFGLPPSKILKYFFFFIPISLVIGQVAVSLVVFFLVIFFFFNIKDTRFIFINLKKYDFILILFFFYILVSSIFFKDINILNNAFLIFRFLVFYFAIKYIIVKFQLKDLKIFFKIILTLSIFIIFDLFFQKYFGKDIFGYTAPVGNEMRLTGPFGNEPIPGSYLVNVGFYSLIYMNALTEKNTFAFYKIGFQLLIFAFGIAIFLTGERMSTILFFLLLFLFFIFFKKNRVKIFITTLFLLISITFITLSNNYYKSRVILFAKGTGILQNKTGENQQLSKKLTFFDSQWGAHILTSYEMFTKNKLFGIGLRQFRHQCANLEYENINSKSLEIRCSSHTHNLYFEILSELGIIGFGLFIIFLYLIIFDFFKLMKNKRLIIDKFWRIFLIGSFCIFFMLFWPIRSTGSFFSNFNGTIYWFNISIMAGLLLKLQLKKY